MTEYRKTPLGESEFRAKQQPLRMITRATLLMVDGKRSVEDIEHSLGKIGDIKSAIAELIALKLIEQVGQAESGAATNQSVSNTDDANPRIPARPTSDTPSAAPKPINSSPTNLYEIRASATLAIRRSLESALGPGADTFMLNIEKAKDASAFGKAVDAALIVLASARNEKAKDALLDQLTKLLESRSS
jgi:hypothetical protein